MADMKSALIAAGLVDKRSGDESIHEILDSHVDGARTLVETALCVARKDGDPGTKAREFKQVLKDRGFSRKVQHELPALMHHMMKFDPSDI